MRQIYQIFTGLSIDRGRWGHHRPYVVLTEQPGAPLLLDGLTHEEALMAVKFLSSCSDEVRQLVQDRLMWSEKEGLSRLLEAPYVEGGIVINHESPLSLEVQDGEIRLLSPAPPPEPEIKIAPAVPPVKPKFQKTCSRSGLKFETENQLLKVHPEISLYTAHKNSATRKLAIRVIEHGKNEGWETLEQFQEAIQQALTVTKSKSAYDFEGYWAAKIMGSSSRLRFIRKFLKPVDREGELKRFVLRDPGIYECFDRRKVDQGRSWYLVQDDGAITPIDLSVVEARFPPIQAIPSAAASSRRSLVVNINLGDQGSIVEYQNSLWTITKVEIKNYWKDSRGITHSGPPGWDSAHTWSDTETHLRRVRVSRSDTN